MEEICEICDRITILRDGRTVLTEDIAKLTMPQVIDQIVGRKVEQTMEWKEHAIAETGQVLLQVRALSAGDKLRGINLEVREGEVVGLAGLMGSGRSELARAIFGIDPIDSGEIFVRGRRVKIRRPEDAIAAGIALIPEDRRLQGVALDHSVRENFLLPILGRLSYGGLVDDRKGDRLAELFVGKLSIRLRSIRQTTRLLSGGNQQKVVIAKWLGVEPLILIMDEPTAGVDVGTKGEIVTMIREFAKAGNAVIIISSELPELLAVSDRVLILRDGTIEREIPRGDIHAEEELHHAVQAAA
jgi:ribose transport system ATP-binding protein